MNSDTEIRPGVIVVFRDPNPDELDKDGNQIPMMVVEVNGDRARLQALLDLPIQPQSVYLVSDLKVALGRDLALLSPQQPK